MASPLIKAVMSSVQSSYINSNSVSAVASFGSSIAGKFNLRKDYRLREDRVESLETIVVAQLANVAELQAKLEALQRVQQCDDCVTDEMALFDAAELRTSGLDKEKSLRRKLRAAKEDLTHEKARLQVLITEVEELKISTETATETIKCLTAKNINLHFSSKAQAKSNAYVMEVLDCWLLEKKKVAELEVAVNEATRSQADQARLDAYIISELEAQLVRAWEEMQEREEEFTEENEDNMHQRQLDAVTISGLESQLLEVKERLQEAQAAHVARKDQLDQERLNTFIVEELEAQVIKKQEESQQLKAAAREACRDKLDQERLNAFVVEELEAQLVREKEKYAELEESRPVEDDAWTEKDATIQELQRQMAQQQQQHCQDRAAFELERADWEANQKALRQECNLLRQEASTTTKSLERRVSGAACTIKAIRVSDVAAKKAAQVAGRREEAAKEEATYQKKQQQKELADRLKVVQQEKLDQEKSKHIQVDKVQGQLLGVKKEETLQHELQELKLQIRSMKVEAKVHNASQLLPKLLCDLRVADSRVRRSPFKKRRQQ